MELSKKEWAAITLFAFALKDKKIFASYDANTALGIAAIAVGKKHLAEQVSHEEAEKMIKFKKDRGEYDEKFDSYGSWKKFYMDKYATEAKEIVEFIKTL